LRLVGQLWSSGDVKVVLGATAPVGYRIAEQYMVAPNLERARMLLPALSHQARSKALSQYNQLRRGRVRASRTLLASAARTGLDRQLLRDVLSVCVPGDATTEQLADQLPLHRLTQTLGGGPLHAAIGVANPSPNRKPTLQLFHANGTPAAFVKVGWNELTRGMVDNEARTLDLLVAAGLPTPRRPKQLRLDRWHDMVLLATEPMPLAMRRQPSAVCPPLDLSALPTASPAGPGGSIPLELTPFWERLMTRVRGLPETGQLPSAECDVVTNAATLLASQGGQIGVRNQPWHGDWVHWNMASFHDELWVWDWEHFADDAPRCFDALHFWFQHEFIIRRRSFGEAMHHAATVTAAARSQAFDSAIVDLIPLGYVIEVYLRAARMAELGADWDPRFHEPALEWLATAVR
jgi:hypothetical protein